jgi:L-lactate dehydrogenase (cytochrome)
MEIYLDGGIRRGTDVIKALALGATAVGLGRPFLMSLVYGKPGVHKVVQIMRDEISRNMALIGARNIGEIVPEMLNISELQRDLSRTIKL